MIDLVVGKVYRRLDLHAAFGGQRQGGISTPARFPMIFLFTGEQGEQYGYHDGFQDDDLFWYTGEGQVGDMEMLRGNEAIRSHKERGKTLHLFMYVGPGLVKYVGEASYHSHHLAIAPDVNKNSRQVIVFELLVRPDDRGVADLSPDPDPQIPMRLWREPLQKLREVALAEISRTDSSTSEVRRYFRSEIVRIYVLRRSGGVCEGCGSYAPFLTPRGKPYLESLSDKPFSPCGSSGKHGRLLRKPRAIPPWLR